MKINQNQTQRLVVVVVVVVRRKKKKKKQSSSQMRISSNIDKIQRQIEYEEDFI